ncbi:paraquat-inducible protein A [Planctobacterium marinum]|uniref:paraquat-inducible protein A n=1 Tax=Planctobacterium marinum TaxID=1631968 RepID=UPI001E444A7F|nr:paraquat-inducible protein A [Planctobacterium marinum]MCC2607265.1 paraquat-inducible protein A [Planctobacterium marinum]
MDNQAHTIHCHECAANVRIEMLPPKHRVICPQCRYLLTAKRTNAVQKVALFSLTSLLFLLLSLPFEFISFSAAGKTQSISIPSGLAVLVSNQYLILAIIESFFILFIPAIVLGTVFYLSMSVLLNKRQPYHRRLTHMVFQLLPWSMAEIFLISVLVSLVKIISLADVSFGPSFFTFCAFVGFSTLTVVHLDEHEFRAITQALIKPRHKSRQKSINQTWGLLIVACLLYIPANLWPIMKTQFLGQSELSTILGGVYLLWESGSYPVAIIIFTASVVVPVVKLLILCWLNATVQHGIIKKPEQKMSWYRLTELIGKWSMVDVFVVAILVSLVQLGGTMSIYPGPAALAFSGVVIVTMFAAHSFDSKLLWKTDSR